MPRLDQRVKAKEHVHALHHGLSPRALTCLTNQFGKDFTPADVIAEGPRYLMRIPNLGTKTVKEIVAWVRASNALSLPPPSSSELEALFEDADALRQPGAALRMAMRGIVEGLSDEDRERALARARQVLRDVRLAGLPPGEARARGSRSHGARP